MLGATRAAKPLPTRDDWSSSKPSPPPSLSLVRLGMPQVLPPSATPRGVRLQHPLRPRPRLRPSGSSLLLFGTLPFLPNHNHISLAGPGRKPKHKCARTRSPAVTPVVLKTSSRLPHTGAPACTLGTLGASSTASGQAAKAPDVGWFAPPPREPQARTSEMSTMLTAMRARQAIRTTSQHGWTDPFPVASPSRSRPQRPVSMATEKVASASLVGTGDHCTRASGKEGRKESSPPGLSPIEAIEPSLLSSLVSFPGRKEGSFLEGRSLTCIQKPPQTYPKHEKKKKKTKRKKKKHSWDGRW